MRADQGLKLRDLRQGPGGFGGGTDFSQIAAQVNGRRPQAQTP